MSNHTPKYCSPRADNNTYTCFSLTSLKKIANELNKTGGYQLNTSQEKKPLYFEIKAIMDNQIPCKEDYCWLKNPIIQKLGDLELEYATFLPQKPKEWSANRYTWLSTLDIRNVLLQYEEKYPNFSFIGPVPIDFDTKKGKQCISPELCNIDVSDLITQGKKLVGIVFNQDKHNMPGSHWVSLFVDLTKGGIYYFDSVGKLPKKEVVDLMIRLKKQANQCIFKGILPIDDLDNSHCLTVSLKKKSKSDDQCFYIQKPFNHQSEVLDGMFLECDGHICQIQKSRPDCVSFVDSPPPLELGFPYTIKGFRLFYNDYQHQRKNSECGVYSIIFIKSMLEGIPFLEFTSKRKNDEWVNKQRDRFYRPS